MAPTHSEDGLKKSSIYFHSKDGFREVSYEEANRMINDKSVYNISRKGSTSQLPGEKAKFHLANLVREIDGNISITEL